MLVRKKKVLDLLAQAYVFGGEVYDKRTAIRWIADKLGVKCWKTFLYEWMQTQVESPKFEEIWEGINND